MAYKVIILYRLYMPSYFLGTFTEYPLISAFFVSFGIDFHSGEFFDAPLWNLRCVIVRFTWNFFLSAYA
jgi:hypothetical protein